MKQQISRLSPHQNGKVFAILMALSSLVIAIPFMLIASAFGPQNSSPSFVYILVFPIMYLLIGYISVAAGCAIYNFFFKYIGGVEFEARGTDA